MSRNRMATELQKTYDDSYLSCSTAVFYEGQGNEAEATRYWKNALDRICDYHKTQPFPTTRGDQAQVEQSLFKAIKELEYQCRERIDILEALRASRQYGPGDLSGIQSTTNTDGDSIVSTPGSKFIGQGTIPAVTYSELSRPQFSHRQSPPPRRSSESSRVSLHRSSIDANTRHTSSQGTPSLNNTPRPGKSSRPSSPEKHSMRTTLRSGKAIEKYRQSPQTPRTNGEGSSKAATLAWNTFGLRDSAHQSSPQDAPSSSNSGFRQLAEQFVKSRRSPPGWDDRLRKHVSNGEADSLSARSRQPADWSSSQPSLLSISAASNALGSSANSEPPMPDKAQAPSGRSSTSYLLAAYSASPRTPRGEPTASSSDSNLPASQEKPNDLSTPSNKGAARGRASRSGPIDSGTIQQIRFRCDKCAKPHSSPKGRDADAMHNSPSPAHRRYSESRRYSLSARRDQGKEDGGDEGADVEEGRRKSEEAPSQTSWTRQKAQILKTLPPGVDEDAARQILNDIVVQGDEVHWGDIAGLDVAKNALREAVVYPFLRPDLFMGLREPARGMLLFGPPGTGKTMLARAVATESRSTFFSISASSLTSKYLGESEKLVKALFSLARALAPSIIFVDEIDSLLSQRSGSGEHEATRRIKTEFLIQWSDLQRAAAGREVTEKDRERGDANRVLVLAATNMPWAIDEAARRRFVRRQYIPLPEATTRKTQLGTLLGQQKHDLSAADLDRLVELTDGFSGSDITALAKDAAMGPLRSLGEALLHMTMDDIRPIQVIDFESSLATIRPSVSKRGLEQYEDWAKEFGERGG